MPPGIELHHLDPMPEEVLRTNLMWMQALIDEIGDDPDLINRIVANFHRRWAPESEAAVMQMMEQIGVAGMVEIGEALAASMSEADGGAIRLLQLHPHGTSEQNPHTLTPEGDRCFACGKVPPGDEGERWQRFEDIPRAEGRPLTEDVLRRMLKDATSEELHRHLEYAEQNAPPGDETANWIRRLISER